MTDKHQTLYSFSVRTESKPKAQDLSALAKQWNAGVRVTLTNPYHTTRGSARITFSNRETESIGIILPSISQPSKPVKAKD